MTLLLALFTANFKNWNIIDAGYIKVRPHGTSAGGENQEMDKIKRERASKMSNGMPVIILITASTTADRAYAGVCTKYKEE